MNLTVEAKTFWEKLPADVRVKLLNNVWCTQCRTMVSIGNVEGKLERGDLILKGACTTCSGPVARLIEGS